MIRCQIVEGTRGEVEAVIAGIANRTQPPPCTCCPDPQRAVEIKHLAYSQWAHGEVHSALVLYEDGARE